MRVVLLLLTTGAVFAAQPILYNRGAVNAASLAPPGLPNAAIARGSTFSVFGENLGPAQSPALAFPLVATLGGVSLSLTQGTVVTQAFPTYVSASQINAILPSTVTSGAASLRVTVNNVKSNAITVQIANSAPGVFAISSGGFGPGVIQNYIDPANQPVNSLDAPAAPGQVITIWGTGLGPVTFADNVAPTPGNVSTAVTLTVGGQTAAVAYSGRSPCCSGVDQIVATLPSNVPLGCWVPVSVNAGGVVSNTTTMAIAAAGASACDDPGNPFSNLVRTPGTQALIDLELFNTVENLDTATPATSTLMDVYSRFYTRPASTFSFDPYLSYPPAGTCLVHEASGDAALTLSLRGAIPASAALSPQPNQSYNDGTQSFSLPTTHSFLEGPVGGTIDALTFGLNPTGQNASYTIDPGGANQKVLSITPESPPVWTRPSGIMVVPRNAPLTLTFTPGDAGSLTAIVLNAYAAATNSTVEVQCLAAPGAGTFTIPADALANLPPSGRMVDGSHAELMIGTLGLNKASSFTSGLAAIGLFVNSSWLSQTVVLP